MSIEKSDAINRLGNWNYKIVDNNLSQITFYDNDGNEIPKPTNFPSDADISTKQAEMETAEPIEAQAIIDAKASGNTKLLDLGLTQTEATALTGYTPPVAE